MGCDSIFLLGADKTLVEMSAEAYDSEARLQEWLAKWPNLLAGAQVNPEAPRQWLFVKREVGIPGQEEGGDQWSLDHLFLDQDGIPTFVEVKRSSDTRLRREVVGQMLDYAANAVVYWPPDRIREFVEAQAKQGSVPGEALKIAFGDEVDPEAYWTNVRTNLQARRIRLLFVADQIPPELRRIVEFLNEQMDETEVLALEIKQYVSGGMHTFVPRVFGQTSVASVKKGRQSRIWDEELCFTELKKNCPEASVRAAREILNWLRHNFSTISYGTGSQQGSFGAGLKRRFFNVYTYGSFEICFEYLKTSAPFKDVAHRQELLQRLNEVPGISLSADRIELRPSIKLEKLPDENAVQELIAVLDWVVAELRKAGSMPLSPAVKTNLTGTSQV